MAEESGASWPTRDEAPSLGSALERTYEAGQQYVADRVELALVETQQTARRAALAGVVLGAGGVLALLGWVAVMAALVLWEARPSSELRLLALGLLHVLAGGLLLAAGLQRARRHGSQPTGSRSGRAPAAE